MPIKSLLLLFGVTFIILSAVSIFNFKVDPMCYYHCEEINLNKSTMNTYYHIGQKILAHKDAKIIMLGSSRGQTTPPLWIQERTRLKTVNLSMGGAEISAKHAFLNLALSQMKVKKIIWFADFFELTSGIRDPKIKNTKALRKYLDDDESENRVKNLINELTSLIDHNTFEASIYALKNASKIQLDQGSGSFLDYKLCDSSEYKGERPKAEVEKEIGFIYDSYTKKVLKNAQSERDWNEFESILKKLSLKGIDVLVLITPYHPEFIMRLKKEFPEIYERHQKWVSRLKSIKLEHIKIADYFTQGLPGDDGSEKYWNDGVHFTCKGSVEMLKKEL
jgi:hypothetical protein